MGLLPHDAHACGSSHGQVLSELSGPSLVPWWGIAAGEEILWANRALAAHCDATPNFGRGLQLAAAVRAAGSIHRAVMQAMRGPSAVHLSGGRGQAHLPDHLCPMADICSRPGRGAGGGWWGGITGSWQAAISPGPASLLPGTPAPPHSTSPTWIIGAAGAPPGLLSQPGLHQAGALAALLLALQQSRGAGQSQGQQQAACCLSVSPHRVAVGSNACQAADAARWFAGRYPPTQAMLSPHSVSFPGACCRRKEGRGAGTPHTRQCQRTVKPVEGAPRSSEQCLACQPIRLTA